jgi:hypothetical protein
MAKLVVAFVLLLSAACHTTNNPTGRWAYGISREAYGCDADWFHVHGINHPGELLLVPVLYSVPFVLDTVLLPITLSRDVMYP